MNRREHLLPLVLLVAATASGCAAPGQRVDAVRQSQDNNQLTLGKVQQTLKKGMRQDEIVAALGSPNMVTRDRNGLETWIYDKLRTEVTSASASDRVGVIGAAGGDSAIVGGGIGQSSSAMTATRSQRSLTVILKFQDQLLVDYAFNATSF